MSRPPCVISSCAKQADRHHFAAGVTRHRPTLVVVSHGVGLADILRKHGQSYLDTHALSVVQDKAWRAIVAYRTQSLGGHIECCDCCGTLRYRYHSCRNRHCPQCQTRTKEAWLAARRRELLPVPYFHLVFTLPHALNGLAGCDARTLYKLLFGAVADTLNAFATNPRWLGGTTSFTLVLHTWKQDLGRHIHIHALVAGGALTMEGKWVSAKHGFLFPVKALSVVYRGKFMDALDAVHKTGSLRYDAARDDASWHTLLPLCTATTGWCMPSNRWAVRRKCWNISGAIRIGWRFQTSASSA
ncbi:hypothetical protein NTGM5_80064 [Candidatus Nitrotoga sp. M5]|nr:hypothetical protein NTGM5_80064 [Candidatus Nitrotoga sp. M5]